MVDTLIILRAVKRVYSCESVLDGKELECAVDIGADEII